MTMPLLCLCPTCRRCHRALRGGVDVADVPFFIWVEDHLTRSSLLQWDGFASGAPVYFYKHGAACWVKEGEGACHCCPLTVLRVAVSSRTYKQCL